MASLEIAGVDKRYGGVQALKGASLTVVDGEVHGLLGPNGSGKSTLNKVATGAVRPDRATITIDGRPVTINGPRDAHRHGIASVYQQLSLVPHLTVEENLVLGTEAARAGWLTPAAQRDSLEALMERLRPVIEADVSLSSRVGALNPGTRQLLEFGKAVLRRPRFLVLDEATASLHHDQVMLLFEIVRELTATGTGVVFVSHRMEEVMSLCRRATIIRNGLNIATVDIASTTPRELVHLMVGEMADAPPRSAGPARAGTPLLAVEHLSASGLHDVSLDVHPGEIVGLGGLQGQGQSELLLALFGAIPTMGGSLQIDGRPVSFANPRQAIRARVALVPGDRGTEGLYSQRSIQENISTATLSRRAMLRTILSMKAERDAAQSQVRALRIKIGALSDPVSSLSGGNAQKVVLAKWLLAEPRIILLDDPTKGVDVLAKLEIYSIIRKLTSRGVAVILNSSDDMELTELADRVLVLYEGRIVRELVGADVTKDALVGAALRIDDAEGEDGQ